MLLRFPHILSTLPVDSRKDHNQLKSPVLQAVRSLLISQSSSFVMQGNDAVFCEAE